MLLIVLVSTFVCVLSCMVVLDCDALFTASRHLSFAGSTWLSVFMLSHALVQGGGGHALVPGGWGVMR